MTMSKPPRQLKLGAFFSTPGNHLAGWRHPDAVPTVDMDFREYVKLAQTAERGCFDMIFFQDTVAVAGSRAMARGQRNLARLNRIVKLEPTALITALSAVTSHIGLVATATATFNEPYNIARRFLTMDHISGGRIGWNLVTSQIEDEGGNFGFDDHVDHALRYERATEFYEVVAGLWDSWEDDAFLHDKAAGIYYDVDKLHFLHHKGRFFDVRGPLNVSRARRRADRSSRRRDRPKRGGELAARTARMWFSPRLRPNSRRREDFYADVKGRIAARYGRSPDAVKIMPGITPVIGRTQAEAKEKYDFLQSMLPDDLALEALTRLSGGLDLRKFPLDGPLPDLPPTEFRQAARQQLLVDLARRTRI